MSFLKEQILLSLFDWMHALGNIPLMSLVDFIDSLSKQVVSFEKGSCKHYYLPFSLSFLIKLLLTKKMIRCNTSFQIHNITSIFPVKSPKCEIIMSCWIYNWQFIPAIVLQTPLILNPQIQTQLFRYLHSIMKDT